MASYFILKLKITLFYLFSFVFIRFTTPCHSLSVIVICFTSFHLLPLVVTCCHSLCHSLSFVLPLTVIRCHSLYHSLSLVVNRYITRLSFYKRSASHPQNIFNLLLFFFTKSSFFVLAKFVFIKEYQWQLQRYFSDRINKIY